MCSEPSRRSAAGSFLGPGDPLPADVRRVLVAGAPGAGKTTLARRIGAARNLPHTELDGLYHGPGWVPRPSFTADVDRFTAEPRWVTEWQYPVVRELLLQRADLLVWLDLPRALVVRRVVRRTLARRLDRQELWNGNQEPSLLTFLTDRDHIVRWSWRTQPRLAGKVERAAAEHPHLAVVRLRTPREVVLWSAGPLTTPRP
ncbi:AAA family ATPase [Kineococcus gynurae]|uniref:AAA family ATPase n=1 Tax=Kineococcus gynurae TaxID=452979 RepID=A0ABV5LRN3_9ACTN